MEKNSAPKMAPEKLEVHVQQARDIRNICIYHKQDVYAKLCLTSDPGSSISTKTINGAGQNPIFDEKLQFGVQSLDSSLKCEIWMLSRVKNYLEDQLLGFALVPLQEIAINGGRLSGEFSLTSTDIYHSPAGLVQLSVSFSDFFKNTSAVDPPQRQSRSEHLSGEDKIQYEKIEFPDPEIVDETKRMVSEIFGIHSESLDVQSDCSETPDSAAGVRLLESFSSESPNSPAVSQTLTPPSLSAGSPQIIEVESAAESPPVIKIDPAPEPGVVQQEIVDLYMKSMQQFTESLAKMKLPMDLDHSNGGSEIDAEAAKSGAPNETGSKVFYGSRAFY